MSSVMFWTIRKSMFSAVVLLLVLSCSASSYASVFYVRQSGSDSNNGLSKELAFRTINKAILAASGDTIIYVGAGDYAEAIYRNFNTSTTGDFQIIGDIAGTNTGDAGVVSISSLSNYWGLRLYRLESLQVSNITFRASGGATSANGCYIYATTGATQFSNCRFEALRYGVYCHTCTTTSIDQCYFEDISVRSTVAYRGDAHAITNCSFKDCRYGVYANAAASTSVSNSTFTALENVDGTIPLNYAIQISTGDLTVTSCQMDNPWVGVYGANLSSAHLADLAITFPRSWGATVTGMDLQAEDVQVTGKGDRKGYGLRLQDLDGQSPVLKNCSCTGLYAGFLATNNDYTFNQVALESNAIGLYVTSAADDFELSNSDKIDITDNYIGIHGRHSAASPGKITLRGLDVRNNDFGFLSYDSSVEIDQCTFQENSVGLRADRAPLAVVRKSKFLANNTRQVRHHYGLQLDCDSCVIDDCELSENQTGLWLRNRTGNAPELSKLTIKNNSYAGLTVTGGELALDANSRISISGGQYGYILRQIDCTLSGADKLVGTPRPITHSDGKLTVSDMDFENGELAIYAVRTELELARCSFSGNSNSGAYLNISPSCSIDGCVFDQNNSMGLRVHSVSNLSIKDSQFTNSPGYGVYVYNPDGITADLRLVGNTISKNRYGFRGIGVPFDSSTSTGNRFQENTHGLRVERDSLHLHADNDNSWTGNSYAIMSYYGELDVDGIKTSGNANVFYSYSSDTEITNCELQPSGNGLTSYSGRTDVDSLTITSGNYGVYLSPRFNTEHQIKLSNLNISNVSLSAVHIRSYQTLTPKVTLADAKVDGCRYGIYSYGGELNASRCSINGATSHAVYQVYGDGEYRDVEITNAASWGLNSQYGDIELNSVSVQSRYGVYLRSDSARLVNTVIKGSVYGAYTNNSNGQFQIMQSTIGGISHYGILHNAGDLTLRNSIVDAGRFALWNRATTGTFEHDYNLVTADQTAYVNELPGVNEIEKSPIFVDEAGGDLHLASGSPAINAGTDLSAVTITDIEGNARPAFRQFELGAFEYTNEEGSLRILEWDEKAQ